MFSRLRQRTCEEVVTEEDVENLRSEVSKLQKQLHQIVDQEIAVNNEACGVATNGIVQLNIELENLREEQCRLQEELDLETEALKALEGQCEEQLDNRREWQDDVVRLRSAMEAANAERNTLQAEIKQSNYFQEQVDNETYYRLLADVQNLETEKERDVIHMRQLNSTRQELQSVLDQLTAERDAFEVIATKFEKELQDERMTLDMYKSHHEALHEHAERLGVVGKMDNVISSFKGFFNNINKAVNESEQPTTVAVKETNKTDSSREKVRRDSGKSSSEKSPAAAAAVGGIAYNTDSVPSSDFFRKTPKIFKIGGGGGGGGGSSGNQDVLNSILNADKEIRISDESSAQSSITMSDHNDEVTASMTEKSEDNR